MQDRVRPSAAPWLVVAILILLVAGAVIAFVPLVECPRCCTWNFFGPFEDGDVAELAKACRDCDGRRKVALYRRWSTRTPR